MDYANVDSSAGLGGHMEIKENDNEKRRCINNGSI